MKKAAIIFLLIVSGFYANAQQRPNIIVFLVDDMGWQDCSVPFYTNITEWNKRYQTPNMQKLASEGMKFTNAYATPVCSPSRVSLMTGMNAAHHRVTSWTLEKDQSVDQPDSLLQPPQWNVNGMSPVAGVNNTVFATPLPLLLQQQGYYTIQVGKAHFGAMNTPAADAHNIGFNVSIAGHAAGGPGSYLGEKNYGNKKGTYTPPWGVPGLEAYHGSDTFLTEALTLEAIKAMKMPVLKKQPFFLYFAHYAVHVPLAADDRFYQKYIDAGLSIPEAQYASMIEGMDKSLGDIMHYLKENKLDKNTVLIFLSDNGGLSLAPPRGGKPHTQNLPLKAGKGSVYEGGIRVPMIVKWPGVAKTNSTAGQYVLIEDLFPTILQMAGVKKYHTVQSMDGKSFIPIINNPLLTDTSRTLVWHFPNKWIPEDGPGINFKSALRQGNWKLIYNMQSGKKELYNLKEDIGETNDLSNLYPAKVKKLSSLLGKRLKDWNALMPVFKAENKVVPYPGEM